MRFVFAVVLLWKTNPLTKQSHPPLFLSAPPAFPAPIPYPFRRRILKRSHFPNEERKWKESHGGKKVLVRVLIWKNMLMRRSQSYEMHQHPFTLLRVERLNEQGKPRHRRSMWLIILGQRRDEIPCQQVAQAWLH